MFFRLFYGFCLKFACVCCVWRAWKGETGWVQRRSPRHVGLPCMSAHPAPLTPACVPPCADAKGRKLTIVKVPCPPAIFRTYKEAGGLLVRWQPLRWQPLGGCRRRTSRHGFSAGVQPVLACCSSPLLTYPARAPAPPSHIYRRYRPICACTAGRPLRQGLHAPHPRRAPVRLLHQPLQGQRRRRAVQGVCLCACTHVCACKRACVCVCMRACMWLVVTWARHLRLWQACACGSAEVLGWRR